MRKSRSTKILLYGISIIVILLLSLYALLRSSAVQSYLTAQIAAYISKELNTKFIVGGVDIEVFPEIYVALENVYLEDLHGDTLLYANRLKFNPATSGIDFDGHQLKLDKIVLLNTIFNLKKYVPEDHLSIQFIIDALRPDDTTGTGWTVSCNTIELINSGFSYKDEHHPPTKSGLNYHDINASHINARISNLIIDSDTIWGNIEALSCAEKSGFLLDEFTANVKLSPAGLYLDNLSVKTPLSNIKTQLSFQYTAYKDFFNFIDEVKINSDFEKSEIGFEDIAFFAPGIHGLSENVSFSGQIKGNIRRLNGKNIDIAFGESGRFYGDINLTGLPYMKETFIHLKVKELKTKQRDLRQIPIPPFIEKKYFKVPEKIASLGDVKFKGEFTGFYNDFVAYGNFITGIGRFASDVSLKEDTLAGKVSYSGSLASDDFDIGKFLNLTGYLGKTGFDVHIDGSGSAFGRDDAEARLKGLIRNIEFNNYNYRNVDIEGELADRRFNGLLLVNDENVAMDFNGKIDFTETPPVFDFMATVGNANLPALNFDKRDTLSYLSATMDCSISGDDIDNLEGSININNIIYRLDEDIFEAGDLSFHASKREGVRYLQLNSAIADAEIKGNFNLGYLAGSFNKLLHRLLPSVNAVGSRQSEVRGQRSEVSKKDENNSEDNIIQNFEYNIDLKNTEILSRLFLPEVKLISGAHFAGIYDERSNRLVINGSSPVMFLYDKKITQWYMDAQTEKNSKDELVFNLKTGCEQLSFQDSAWIQDINVQAVAGNDSILFGTGWGNEGKPLQREDMNGYVSFMEGREPVFSYFFSNFELTNLNPLTGKYKLALKGTANGNATISDLYTNPVFSGNIDIIDLELNENKLGNVSIVSTWNNDSKAVQLIAGVKSGELETIAVLGTYYPDGGSDKLAFDINLDKFKMYLFEPFVEGIFSDIRGIASGNLRLTGNFSEPVLTGKLDLQKTGFKIGYTNTSYSFANEINFYENRIGFNDLILNDSKGNHAVANGNIYHDYLKDFIFDIKIDAENLYCLNTDIKQNNLYYGEMYATGQAMIKGGIRDIMLDISAVTQKGSRIFIPLSGTEVISENSFITFKPSMNPSRDLRDVIRQPADGIPIRKGLAGINIDIEVTPDAEVQLIFDQKVGDIIKGRGNGNLKMTVDNSGDFNMFGIFTIDRGDYLFTLKNILNKRFDIEKGGSISWNGDPYQADINLKAIYPLRAPLYTLTLDTTDRRRIPVECRLGMTGKLLNPEIKFDIGLPKADEETNNIVKGLITTEQQMNTQVFSLLILGSFQPASEKIAGGGFASSASVGANSSEVLSNQLSNWLSQISKDFDIGVNYRPGDEITDKEVELALSTQLFDERLTINGSVANNPNTAYSGNTNTSSMVGDFNLDYKLTEDGRIRVKAFNKSNDYNIITDNTLYTQGVGISYRREFNTFRELFRRKKKQ